MASTNHIAIKSLYLLKS